MSSAYNSSWAGLEVEGGLFLASGQRLGFQVEGDYRSYVPPAHSRRDCHYHWDPSFRIV